MENSGIIFEKMLLSKLREGDKSVFSAIFKFYYEDLVMFARTYFNEIETAEEIVQDTFVKIWEEHKSLKINVSLKSFLLKSVQNKCIDTFRRRKVKQNYINNTTGSYINYDYSIDNYIFNSELESLIKTALDKLSPEISYVFLMNRYEGLKYGEIAKKLNISVRTVEARIGKALCFLREELKDYLH